MTTATRPLPVVGSLPGSLDGEGSLQVHMDVPKIGNALVLGGRVAVTF